MRAKGPDVDIGNPVSGDSTPQKEPFLSLRIHGQGAALQILKILFD